MIRSSCSTILFKYFHLAVSIGIGQPGPFDILLTALILAVLAPLLSITIFLGNLFASNIPAKNSVADGLFRRRESMDLAVFFDSPLEINLTAFQFDVSLVHSPRAVTSFGYCAPLKEIIIRHSTDLGRKLPTLQTQLHQQPKVCNESPQALHVNAYKQIAPTQWPKRKPWRLRQHFSGSRSSCPFAS